MKSQIKWATLPLIAVLCTPAIAGGLESATTAAEDFSTWLFGFLGVIAIVYLMAKGVQAWNDKIQWSDFLWAIGKVSVVGGSVGLTTWAWQVFA